MNKTLAERPMSGFPISIGSSLSLETLFAPLTEVYDDSRTVPEKANLAEYTLYVFNVSTLLRNLINSIPYMSLIMVPKKDILEALLEEIEFLTNFFASNSLNIKFYINDYSFVKRVYKPEQLRHSTTEKQIFIDGINSYCLDKLRKEDDIDLFTKNIHYSKEDKVLLFTHIPFDLLSYSNFVRLDLLESNTGVIKTRKSWNTKYFKMPHEDMSFLPFNEYLLSIFGDHVMFIPAPLKKRLEIYESMKKKKVHPLMDVVSFEFIFGK